MRLLILSFELILIITVHCRVAIRASVNIESAWEAGIKDRVKIIQFSASFGTKS
jgi:hypothetical protein